MAYLVSNGGISTLASGITTTTQTSIVLASGHGARFPSPTGGDYTLVTLENTAGVIEIVSIVGRSTDTLTVGVAGSAAANATGRGQEGTTAAIWLTGDIIEGRATAAIVARGGNAKTTAELIATSGSALIGSPAGSNLVGVTVAAQLVELGTGLNINAATAKATPVDADKFGYWDSVSGLLRSATWANIKTVLKAYFDPIYATIAQVHYVGTTSIAANRGSLAQTLTGVSIDGIAASATTATTATTATNLSGGTVVATTISGTTVVASGLITANAGISTTTLAMSGASTLSASLTVTPANINITAFQGISTNATGVYGISTNSIGTYGTSNSSYGVYGTSTSGYGMAGSSLQSLGRVRLPVTVIALGAYTLPVDSYTTIFNSTVVVTLPSAASYPGVIYRIVLSSTTGTDAVYSGSTNVRGYQGLLTPAILPSPGAQLIQSTGTEWTFV